MSAYEEMQSFLAELQDSKNQLNDRKIVLVSQRAAKAAEIDEALLTGDGADIQAALDAIDGETAAIEQRIRVIDATLSGQRKSPQLGDLAAAAVAESRERIVALQQDWDSLAEKLAELDVQRLELVADLGRINREAQSLTSRAVAANDKTMGPRTAAPSLATNVIIRHDRRSGVIFPDHASIEKTFKGV